MIQLSSIHKAFGARILFDAVRWQVRSGERVGLCGPNGAGKTTLLRIMAGLEEPDDGTVARSSDLTVGFLPQDGISHTGRTLFDEAALSFQDLMRLQNEMQELEVKMGDSSIHAEEHQQLLTRYADVQETFHHKGGYDIEARVSEVLNGLGFSQADISRRTEEFSGGWQMRIALAKLLLKRPRLLLMDEPTNHLDLEARNWLEDFLLSYPHAVVMVSHDRFFLDRVVTSIAEVSLRTLTPYPGDYSSYLVERDARLQRLRQEKQQQDNNVARMQAFIDRFRYQATKAAQVQSRVKMLEKITPIEVPPEPKRVHFTFPASAKSGRTILEFKNIYKSYKNLKVFDDISVHIERGDRIALVGPNGAGKSTLMRMLSGVESPDSGTRIEGHNVITQYFAQDEATRLDPSLTVYETLSSGSPVRMVPTIRNILGGFLFEDDDIHKRVKVLSGGERTRLAVARMLLHSSNTLLLDEPTNHLDIDSTNVLLDALSDYGGTLIFVSHDRYFVDRLATKILQIGDLKANLYPGTYEEFRWSKAQQQNRESVTNRPIPHSEKQSPSRQISERKRIQLKTRRLERRRRSIQERIVELEQQISEREQAIRALEINIAEPDFYNDEANAKACIDKHQVLMWEVGDLMNEWETLQKEAEELSEKIQRNIT